MTDHPLRLRNSATGTKDPFVPRDWRGDAPEDERRVRMYVCGPTVYDRAHIGNARPAVVFDVLFRLLRHLYDDRVTYVRNLTDVEDKINDRAAERWPDMDPLAAIARLTAETTAWYHEDMDALGVLRPTFEPRATEHVPGMVEMIAALVASGHAYEAEGHVLFDVSSYPAYGALSGRSVDDMIAGARVEVAPYKKHPMDFVLWKPSSSAQPGWESPWGRGRPGWHIECSAMSKALLGEDFDIHGGGADLLFPHHENEAAQSCCASPGHRFAEVWLHNGMIRVEGRKMSKSLGNFITVADLREHVDPEVIRLVLLSTHYRKELDWTESKVDEARGTLDKWYSLVGEIEHVPAWLDHADQGRLLNFQDRHGFLRSLCDDLNTPAAIAQLNAMAAHGERGRLKGRHYELKKAAAMLGLLQRKESEWRRPSKDVAGHEELIEDLLAARAEARRARDFARADAIREAFAAAGVMVKDTPQGAEWELSPDFDPAKLEDVR